MTAQAIHLLENGPFSNRGLSVFNDNLSLPRHRWFEFKEGYSAVLVQEAIGALGGSNTRRLRVLDPFSGSGTTLVTAQSTGHAATGIEVNPFLAFAGQVKTTELRQEELNHFQTFRDQCLDLDIAGITSPLEGFSTFTEGNGKKKWLFNLPVARAVAAVQRHLQSVPAPHNHLLHLALLAAALECSNAKRDGKCLRYIKNWQKLSYTQEHLFQAFHRRTQVMLEDLRLTGDRPPSEVRLIGGDSRRSLRELTQQVDLVVTSPPYLNSFDYSDVYRPEMFLGRFVKDNQELQGIRKQTVRSHVQTQWELTNECSLALLRTYVKLLRESPDLWDRRLPDMVQAYFDDMLRILTDLKRTVTSRGQVWFVVSTSAYSGVEIPVDLILAEVGELAGFRLENVHVLRRLRASGQHWAGKGNKPPLRESLIIWSKP